MFKAVHSQATPDALEAATREGADVILWRRTLTDLLEEVEATRFVRPDQRERLHELIASVPDREALRMATRKIAFTFGASDALQLEGLEGLSLSERVAVVERLVDLDVEGVYASFGYGILKDPSVQMAFIQARGLSHDLRAIRLLEYASLSVVDERRILDGWSGDLPWLYAALDPARLLGRHGRNSVERWIAEANGAFRRLEGQPFGPADSLPAFALTADLACEPRLRLPALRWREACYLREIGRLVPILESLKGRILESDAGIDWDDMLMVSNAICDLLAANFPRCTWGERRILAIRVLTDQFDVKGNLFDFLRGFPVDGIDRGSCAGAPETVSVGSDGGRLNRSEADYRLLMEWALRGQEGGTGQACDLFELARLSFFRGRYDGRSFLSIQRADEKIRPPAVLDAERTAWVTAIASRFSRLRAPGAALAAFSLLFDVGLPIPFDLLADLARWQLADLLAPTARRPTDAPGREVIDLLSPSERRMFLAAALARAADPTLPVEIRMRIVCVLCSGERRLPPPDQAFLRARVLAIAPALLRGVAGPAAAAMITNWQEARDLLTLESMGNIGTKETLRFMLEAFKSLTPEQREPFAEFLRKKRIEPIHFCTPHDAATRWKWLLARDPARLARIKNDLLALRALFTVPFDQLEAYVIREEMWDRFSSRDSADMRLACLWSHVFETGDVEAIHATKAISQIPCLVRSIEECKDLRKTLRFLLNYGVQFEEYIRALPEEARPLVATTILLAAEPAERFHQIQAISDTLDAPGTESEQLVGLASALVFSNPDARQKLQSIGQTMVSGEALNLRTTPFDELKPHLSARLQKVLNPPRHALERAYLRNRAITETSGPEGFLCPPGSLFHYTQLESLPALLDQGNICGECLGVNGRADSFPLHMDALRVPDSFAGASLASVLKDRRMRYEGGKIALVYLDRDHPEAFARHEEFAPAESGIPYHVLLFGGLPKTEVSAIVLFLGGGEPSEDRLVRVREAILDGQLYIPVYAEDGRLLFSHEEFLDAYLAAKPYGSLEAFLGDPRWDASFDVAQSSERHRFTLREHLLRTERAAQAYAQGYGLTGRDVLLVRAAARLHDVGKAREEMQAIANVEDADAWLHKIRRLPREERRQIKRLIRHDELLGDLVQAALFVRPNPGDGSPYPPPGPARDLLERFKRLFPDSVSQRQLLALYRADVHAIDDGLSLQEWRVEATLRKLGLPL